MVKIKNQVCFMCGKKYKPEKVVFRCEKCGGSIDINYDFKEIKNLINKPTFTKAPVSHWKYWMFYPIKNLKNMITLGEGGTPLINDKFHKGRLLKNEGLNPTGSFKDRGSAVEITKAVENKVHNIYCPSTGNMGASIAAYGTRAGIRVTVYVPSGAPPVKVQQIKSYGARVVNMRGTYTNALNSVYELSEDTGAYISGDYGYRGEGEKSTGLEIIDQLNWQIPDYIVIPVGMGNHFWGIHQGLKEAKMVGLIDKFPKLVAIQASGCDTVVSSWKNNDPLPKTRKNPDTIAGAIACGKPNFGAEVLYALKQTKGLAETVTDGEILQARKELGKQGVWAEPAGAVAYAGAEKLGLSGQVVCIITGHGLKDPFAGGAIPSVY
ncbi:MAG: threonine synthase [Candidatus Diapherotrites archaeon]|nr:threonine synthase [Candidatus Diapherotrites archaeon]